VPSVDPAAWQPPKARSLTGSLAPNQRLDAVERWELPAGHGPEDVVLDSEGRVYTGVEDGRIYRFAADGSSAELVADTHGRPLGLELDTEGRLLICDADRGLLRMTHEGELEVLVNAFEGRNLRFTNNAAVAADGVIYFTDTSTRFDIANYTLDLLEHRPHGRLLAHDPRTGLTRMVLDGLHFANGVALAPDDSAVYVAETGSYQVRRHWLGGPLEGETEVVLDRLPGFPDNLSGRGDGTYWLALPDPRNAQLDALLPRPALRRAVAALPDRLRPQPSRQSIVVRFDGDGRVLDALHGPAGTYAFVTGVREHDGWLYLGSLEESAIARVRLS
jgi:strictosidine synthase